MKVIGIGDNVVDDYTHLRKVFPGGNALNFAVFSSQLGYDSAYLGLFGSDDYAHHIQQVLTKIGIDISRCRNVDGPNGRAVLKIEDGERVFISSNEGGIRKSVPMEFIFEDLEYLQSFSIIHSSIYSYLDPYLPRLQELDSLLSYDFSDSFNPKEALLLCKYLDFGFFSCAERTLEDIRELLENAVHNGCGMAVATRGPKEVVLYDGQSWFKQPPEPVTPKDTLGAGDAFISRFLLTYVEGSSIVEKNTLIKDSLEKAVAFAAKNCQVEGSFGYGLDY